MGIPTIGQLSQPCSNKTTIKKQTTKRWITYSQNIYLAKTPLLLSFIHRSQFTLYNTSLHSSNNENLSDHYAKLFPEEIVYTFKLRIPSSNESIAVGYQQVKKHMSLKRPLYNRSKSIHSDIFLLCNIQFFSAISIDCIKTHSQFNSNLDYNYYNYKKRLQPRAVIFSADLSHLTTPGHNIVHSLDSRRSIKRTPCFSVCRARSISEGTADR